MSIDRKETVTQVMLVAPDTNWGIQPDLGMGLPCRSCIYQNSHPESGVNCNRIMALDSSERKWVPYNSLESRLDTVEVKEPALVRRVDRTGNHLYEECSGYRRKWWKIFARPPFNVALIEDDY